MFEGRIRFQLIYSGARDNSRDSCSYIGVRQNGGCVVVESRTPSVFRSGVSEYRAFWISG